MSPDAPHSDTPTPRYPGSPPHSTRRQILTKLIPKMPTLYGHDHAAELRRALSKRRRRRLFLSAVSTAVLCLILVLSVWVWFGLIAWAIHRAIR